MTDREQFIRNLAEAAAVLAPRIEHARRVVATTGSLNEAIGTLVLDLLDDPDVRPRRANHRGACPYPTRRRRQPRRPDYLNGAPAMPTRLDVLDAMLDAQIDGVAEDMRAGEPPESVIAMTVAIYRSRPGAAELLGAALVRLARER